MIGKESDLRRWVRAHEPAAFWVEAAPGGTAGLPDLYVGREGGAWVELKLGKRRANGDVVWRLRPEQKQVLRRFAALGVPVGVLIAEGADFWLATGLERMLGERCRVDDPEFLVPVDSGTWETVFNRVRFSTLSQGQGRRNRCENDPKS